MLDLLRTASDYFGYLVSIEEASVKKAVFRGQRIVAARWIAIAACATASQWAFAESNAPDADSPGTSTASERVNQVDTKNKRICTRERVLGSNFKKTTCRTQATVDADRATARKDLEILSRSYGPPRPGSG
jgi:hypothetical protein